MSAQQKVSETDTNASRVQTSCPPQLSRSSCRLLKESLDLCHFFVRKPERERAFHACYLVRISKANDCAGHSRIVQRPRDCDLARGASVPLADPSQQFDELEIAAQPWFLKIRISPAPVVGCEICDTLPSHLTGEQARTHGRVDDDANPVFSCKRKNLSLGISCEQRVWWLQ